MVTDADADAGLFASLPTIDSSGHNFQWLLLLGRGGFGEVYLARMRSAGGLEQQVAVKLLQRWLNPRSQAVERLRDEARLLASLRHPVVLAAHDLVTLGDRVALITEYIEGQDLADCLEGPDRIPLSALLEVTEAVAGALDEAYRQHKVVHRDIKPSNIRIGVHGNVKLLDFGIARSGLAGREARTQTEALVGTLRYMAPERLTHDTEPGPPSDVFALGAVLFEGVSGEVLLDGLELFQLVRLSADAATWDPYVEERLQRLPTGTPAALQGLLREMLAYDPQARPTESQVAGRCEALVSELAQPLRLSRWCRARRWPSSLSSFPPPVPSTSETLTPAEPSKAELVEAVAPRRRWVGWAVGGAVLSGLSVTGALALGVLVVIGVSLPWWGMSPSPAPEPVPAAPVVVPAPPDPVPAPVPVVAPPESPRPVVRPSKVPVPEPVASEPVASEPVASEPAPPLAPTYSILLSSEPAGADIILLSTGETLGQTPQLVKLQAGSVSVRLRAPNGMLTEQTLQVGRNSPRQYIWFIEKGQFKASY
jgi:serine/threonine protein kinase